MVSPLEIAIVKNAVLILLLSGKPKEILERPQTVARPRSLQYAMVSKVSKAAFSLAETVVTRPSTIISLFVNP